MTVNLAGIDHPRNNHKNYSSPEAFLKDCVAPIISSQGDIIARVARDSIQKEKRLFSQFKQSEQKRTLRTFMAENAKCRFELIGIVLALFSEEEVDYFFQHENVILAAMKKLLIEYLDDHLYQLQ